VNDSKATTFDAALHSIESFDGGLVPILGGKFRRRSEHPAPAIARGHARGAIGEAPISSRGARRVVPVTKASSMGAAVDVAFAMAQPSGVSAAGAGLRQLRHVPDYAEPGSVQGRGRADRPRVRR